MGYKDHLACHHQSSLVSPPCDLETCQSLGLSQLCNASDSKTVYSISLFTSPPTWPHAAHRLVHSENFLPLLSFMASPRGNMNQSIISSHQHTGQNTVCPVQYLLLISSSKGQFLPLSIRSQV